MYGVNIESCSEGGSDVGNINLGDWMDYSVDIPLSGNYELRYRVAGWVTYAEVQFKVDSIAIATNSVPNTGGYQNWTTITNTVNLSSGSNTIRLYASGASWNINWFELEYSSD